MPSTYQYYNSNDANITCNLLLDKIQHYFNESFPLVKLSRKRARDKKWITSGLKKSSRTKAKLYKAWLVHKTAETETKYKNYKKVFKNLALECEATYYRDLFDKKNNSARQIWKNLNTVCSFKGSNATRSISKLISNGTEFSNGMDICSEFNRYFSTVGESLIKNSTQTHSTNANNYKKYCVHPIPNSMFCEPVEINELTNLIGNLNNNKGAGPDNIGPRLLKEISPAIIQPLLYIINLSLSTGVVPDKLKLAKVIPIYKKGEHSLPQNYRPISLLSIFHKILEKIMAKRLKDYLTTSSILYSYQFGFRQNHSTVLALIDVTDDIYSHLENDEYVLGIYLDLQKAFDTVDHTILLWKLHNYGIRGVVHSWFTSYLSNRMQYTFVNNYTSSKLPVSCGVPQGSVLGPLLFLLYINDLPNSLPEEKIKLFADDTNLFVSAKTIKELESKANLHLLSLDNWLKANKLHLNIDKTCYSVFSPNKNCVPTLTIKVSDIKIKCVKECKYLGIIIDNELKWTSHIESVLQKLKRLLGIFYKMRYKLPDWCLRNIYFAFVHPYILYGLEVYGNTYPSYLDKLTVLNNKLLRILQKKERTCCNESLYLQYNTLPPVQLFNYQVLNLVHKVVYSPYLLPPIYQNYFTPTCSFHGYKTRHNKLYLTYAKTRFGQRIMKYKGTQLWNRLPSNIINSTSSQSFRNKLKLLLTCDPM